VIPIPKEPQEQEYVVFDPCAWREGEVFYALIGNKNRRPGYEGDCTSLFKSTNLHHWEYLHPFYRSERRWTDPVEDCACPDFFPLGHRHMLLMHGHRPYGQVHYYLGRYEDERFYPEIHSRMNWPGGQLCAPETLLDDQGRRVFFGWIREARPWEDHGWASVMSLPRLLSLGKDGTLRIEPVPALQALRHNPRRQEGIELSRDSEVELTEVCGDCLEIALTMQPGDAREFGVKVRCSPDGEEETAIVCQSQAGILKVELEQSTLNKSAEYANVKAQEAPFELQTGEPLKLHVFLDRSVLEVFANSRQCVTQRIYPTRNDSLAVRLCARGGSAFVRVLEAWDVSATNSW
jgi:sucrose-6-phosphate hydrolase SacC (GH32 family)